MSLAVNDVERVLATAILDAKMASTPESAEGFAKTLSPALTAGLATIWYPDGEEAPEIEGVPFMTVFEAFKIRDAVAAVISQADEATDLGRAEAVLEAGYIDVPQLLHTITTDPVPSKNEPATGSHTVSPETGMVAVVGAPD